MLVASAALLTCLAIGGCGGETDLAAIDASDPGKVAELVVNLQGAAGEADEVRWKEMMLDPEAISKSQRKAYLPFNFYVTPGDVDISGDTATFTVTISLGMTGEEKGQAEWTAEKVGGEWKLKDIPLPEGISAESGS